MKMANLSLFAVVVAAAAFANWLVFQQFPWYVLPTEELSTLLDSLGSRDPSSFFLMVSRKDIVSALNFATLFQHVFAYVIAGTLAFTILYFGERQIFALQAKTNWKILLPIWALPILCLGSPVAYDEGSWYAFLLFCNWGITGVVAIYSFVYQAFSANRKRVRSDAQTT